MLCQARDIDYLYIAVALLLRASQFEFADRHRLYAVRLEEEERVLGHESREIEQVGAGFA